MLSLTMSCRRNINIIIQLRQVVNTIYRSSLIWPFIPNPKSKAQAQSLILSPKVILCDIIIILFHLAFDSTCEEV